MSMRAPAQFAVGMDLTLWPTRFELYAQGSGISNTEWKAELLPLLDDELFRIVNQLGLVDAGDYADVKASLIHQFAPEGVELEWQHRLQTRTQKAGESLSEFAGALRILSDRAYPSWGQEQKQEMVKNQFIQGIRSASTQLQLMREGPKSPDEALQLAIKQETVEAAQKRMRSEKHPSEVSAMSRPTDSSDQAESLNAVYGRKTDGQLEELTRQVQRLTEQVARLQTDSVRQTQPIKRRACNTTSACWACGERGHLRRDCPRRQRGREPYRGGPYQGGPYQGEPLQRGREPYKGGPYQDGPLNGERVGGQGRPPAVNLKTHCPSIVNNATVEFAVAVIRLVESRQTRMLVDTGSAVTIVSEEVWKEATENQLLHGQPLQVLGRTQLKLQVGELRSTFTVLVVRGVTQECILGADFLSQHNCLVDLRRRELLVGGKAVALESVANRPPSACHVCLGEDVETPAWHQVQLPVKLVATGGELENLDGCLETAHAFLKKHDLLVAHSVSSVKDGQIFTRILNPSPLSVVIHKHERSDSSSHLVRPVSSKIHHPKPLGETPVKPRWKQFK